MNILVLDDHMGGRGGMECVGIDDRKGRETVKKTVQERKGMGQGVKEDR